MIDSNDIDGLAAEYVVGTLDQNERVAVATSRFSNAELNAAIIAWEKRLMPLGLSLHGVAPSADLFSKIEQRLDARVSPPVTAQHKWRRFAMAACVAFVLTFCGLIYQWQYQAGPEQQPVAVLQNNASPPAFLVSLNEKNHTLEVRPSATDLPANKSYELWLIAPGATVPKSLGVIPAQQAKHVELAGFDIASVRNGTLAVSVEPEGGSPTGAPTGPVVFTGKFVQASL